MLRVLQVASAASERESEVSSLGVVIGPRNDDCGRKTRYVASFYFIITHCLRADFVMSALAVRTAFQQLRVQIAACVVDSEEQA